MVKKIATLGLCLFCIFTFSQNDASPADFTNRNELKINGLFLVLGAIEVDYQYLINEESGLGLEVLFSFDDEDLSINYFVSPYYRQYFGKKPASGFFAEGFGMLNSVQDYTYTSIYDAGTDSFYYVGGSDKDIVDFALGIGVGVKFLTSRGFVVELDLGVGRNLFKNDRDYTIIGKGGINLGYRF